MQDVNGSIWSVNPITAVNYGPTVVSFPDTPNDNERTATALEYVGDTLYAAFENPGPETGPGFLGTLNPATGATTGIGVLTGMNAPAGGFAYWNETMYAVSSADSRFFQLYTINLATGDALVADITLDFPRVGRNMVGIKGENMRSVTWVKIEEVPEGHWGIGGNPLTAAMVHELQKG